MWPGFIQWDQGSSLLHKASGLTWPQSPHDHPLDFFISIIYVQKWHGSCSDLLGLCGDGHTESQVCLCQVSVFLQLHDMAPCRLGSLSSAMMPAFTAKSMYESSLGFLFLLIGWLATMSDGKILIIQIQFKIVLSVAMTWWITMHVWWNVLLVENYSLTQQRCVFHD